MQRLSQEIEYWDTLRWVSWWVATGAFLVSLGLLLHGRSVLTVACVLVTGPLWYLASIEVMVLF